MNKKRFSQVLCYVIMLGLLLPGGSMAARKKKGPVFNNAAIKNNEYTEYNVTIGKKKKVFKESILVKKTTYEGNSSYEIITKNISDRRKEYQGKLILSSPELKPLECSITGLMKRRKKEIELAAVKFIDGKVEYTDSITKRKKNITINKKKRKKITSRSDTYMGLKHILRGFPFGKKKKVRFRMLNYKPDQSRFSAKVVGEEKVQVPAGEFDCYKVKVSVRNILMKIVSPRLYFWYTKESPHYLVKYRMGRSIVTRRRTGELAVLK